MEYDVLSVAVTTLKRMDESKEEEQDAAYTCLHLIDSIVESSPDPQISTKVLFCNNIKIYITFVLNRPLKVPISYCGC